MPIIASNFKTNHTRKSTALFVNEVNNFLEKNKISNESPVGAAIVGKRVGDIVEVHVPAGILKYKILTIRR